MKNYLEALKGPADAVAIVAGSENYKNITGRVKFYEFMSGVIVFAEIEGLPKGNKPCGNPVFGFHVHEGGSHYNPYMCPHPYHAGDFPPLFGNDGSAFSIFLTDRFTIPEIIGKMVVIHASADDFKSQPSGNAGEKIATGIIVSSFGVL